MSLTPVVTGVSLMKVQSWLLTLSSIGHGLYQPLARLTCTVMMIGMSGAGFAAPNKTGGLAGAGASIVGQSN